MEGVIEFIPINTSLDTLLFSYEICELQKQYPCRCSVMLWVPGSESGFIQQGRSLPFVQALNLAELPQDAQRLGSQGSCQLGQLCMRTGRRRMQVISGAERSVNRERTPSVKMRMEP